MTPRAALALACAAVLLVIGARNAFWSDYASEAWPAYAALRDEGVHGFLARMPAYSAFVTLFGAPAAFLHGSEELTFRLNALPGLLALAGLALALHGRRQAPLAILL